MGRILDLGCGDAFISRHLAETYPQVRVDAVDTAFEESSYERFADLHRIENLHLSPSMEHVDPEDGQVGLTLVMDVLEHVADDVGLLRSLTEHSSMRDDAYFLLTVPAMQFLYCSHDRLLGHYRRYSYGRLRALATAADLQPVEGGYCFLSGLWVRAGRTILEKSGVVAPLQRTEISAWNGSSQARRLYTGLLNFDLSVSRLLAKAHIRIPGLSCYALCRRRG
ncbi:MAG: class I SAM-dependent methyltransferase [Planctomycetia bacterium]|nr:class I SAM-dependent methyltransferase [Planctomycetia bacterium]